MKESPQEINNFEYFMRWLTQELDLNPLSMSILLALTMLALVGAGLGVKWTLDNLQRR